MVDRVHFITNDFERTHWENAELACKGGIKWIQLRVKNTPFDTWLRIAEKTQNICIKYGSKLIINDNIILAEKILADGVHLGMNDTPTYEARKTLGSNFIIGGSSNKFSDINAHIEAEADYVGIGPFSFTSTKDKLNPILGLEGIKACIHELKEAQKSIPLIAIGGIKLEDVSTLMQTGIHGIAVSSLITSAENPIGMSEKIISKTI